MGARFGTPTLDIHLYSDASQSGWGAHQSSRNEGIVSGTAVISGVGRQSPSDRDVRQLDGGGLRQQAGWDGFPFPLLVGQPASELAGESRHPPRRQVSTRAVQCSGRFPQPSGSGYRDRVVSSPAGGEGPFRRWGSPLIDLFATSLNAKLLLYCSLVPDPQVVFEDAFRHLWSGLDLYAFPSFPLVGRVVAQVRETPNLSMTLVAPLWPEEWFADLLLLLTQPPVALPLWDRLLR